MKIDLQRKIDRIAGTFICRILSLIHLFFKREDAAVRVERILVILLSEMGSLVLAEPMFRRLREKYAGACLHVLVFENNREVLEILEVTDNDKILTICNDSFFRFAADSLRVLIRMRRLRIDTVIDCELFARISSIFSFLSGAQIRVGFHPYTQEGLYRGNFINRPVLYNPYQHISLQFLSLVAAIDSGTVPKSKHRITADGLTAPPVKFDPEVIRKMRQRLQSDFPVIGDRQLVLLYAGGGILPIRAWPLEYFCRLAGELLSNDCAVGVIGLQSDRPAARAILKHCQDPACIDLTGYTESVRDLMIIFHLAALLVTNDGGPGQFAALTPIPAIIFYGPETPVLYRPHDDKAVIFYASLPCSPCLSAYNHRNSPCDGDNLCLKCIPPEQVVAKALEILNGRRQRDGSWASESQAEL